MILENKKIKEQEIKKYSLSDLLEIKKQKFFSNDFYNYSYDEKKAFVEDNKIDAIEIAETYTLLAGQIVFSLGFVMLCFTPFAIPLIAFAIPLIAGGLGLIFFSTTATCKKIIIKRWLSREKDNDILKLAMFLASVVSEDVLKTFVKEYGQNELVNFLCGKEHLTYSEMYDYILDTQSREERKKLTEAVKYLEEEEEVN